MNGSNGLSRFQERAVVAFTVLFGRVKNYLHGVNRPIMLYRVEFLIYGRDKKR